MSADSWELKPQEENLEGFYSEKNVVRTTSKWVDLSTGCKIAMEFLTFHMNEKTLKKRFYTNKNSNAEEV